MPYFDIIFRSHSLWHFTVYVHVTEMKLVSLQQIKKVPVGFVRGFQSLRPQLKTLICTRSLISLNVSSLHSLLIFATMFKAYSTLVRNPLWKKGSLILSGQPSYSVVPKLHSSSCHPPLVLFTFFHSFSLVLLQVVLGIPLDLWPFSVTPSAFMFSCSQSFFCVHGQTSFVFLKTFGEDLMSTHNGRVQSWKGYSHIWANI